MSQKVADAIAERERRNRALREPPPPPPKPKKPKPVVAETLAPDEPA